jgi:hypothetical protein
MTRDFHQFPLEPQRFSPERLHAEGSPDELVTLTTAGSEFEAAAIVATLSEAGIDAVSYGALQSTAFAPLASNVPVQVRRADLERAERALQQNIADSIDIDWDSVDVGEPDQPLEQLGLSAGPVLAMLGFVVAILLVVITIVAAVMSWPRITSTP